MTRLPLNIKERAISLRKNGYSMKEIADLLKIAKSTSSLWLRDIKLSEHARKRLIKRKVIGQYKTSLKWKKKRLEEEQIYKFQALQIFNKIKINKYYAKIYCALLFWCEGGKSDRMTVRFVNSDPLLMKVFLKLLRQGFEIDESKLRALMHLHSYHDAAKQKKFWSRLTKIPTNQFQKTFRKPNTSKRIKDNYPGCLSVVYYDAKTARKLHALYKVFYDKIIK